MLPNTVISPSSTAAVSLSIQHHTNTERESTDIVLEQNQGTVKQGVNRV